MHAHTVFCIPEHSKRPQPEPHAHEGNVRADGDLGLYVHPTPNEGIGQT
jgi:hypothetical protein